MDEYFTNTVSRVGGIGLEEIEADGGRATTPGPLIPWAWTSTSTLDSMGRPQGPQRSQEDHMYNPQTIHLLQQAARTGDYDALQAVHRPGGRRDQAPHPPGPAGDAVSGRRRIPLEEVESVDSIVKRFKTGAMSYGSISQEAHECLALAMNLLGGKSNSGEGGEEPERLGTGPASSAPSSRWPPAGSASPASIWSAPRRSRSRWPRGPSPARAAICPAGKVYPWIAKTRYSTPGVTLISPPPHHDIYSIEDLAQLIYDLKNANRQARISVKLVSRGGRGHHRRRRGQGGGPGGPHLRL